MKIGPVTIKIDLLTVKRDRLSAEAEIDLVVSGFILNQGVEQPLAPDSEILSRARERMLTRFRRYFRNPLLKLSDFVSNENAADDPADLPQLVVSVAQS